MKIGIIVGSHRENSQSSKVAKFLDARLKALNLSPQSYIFDLAGNPLPLWDESVWSNGDVWQEKWAPVAKELQSCDGFVVISPEWGGMVPAALKNFFLLTTPKEVGHKPALITAVSSGIGGSFPVAELRTSGYKNSRINFIPEHLIIRHVEGMFGEASSGKEEDYIRERIDFALRILAEYTKALKPVRDSGVTVDKKFPFGM